ncbi:MAG: hypothetical protein OQK82_01675 [Candidatus Pacearchaeota archaeon]|nr:hypothetical protein [Candidatus Pacearchaeota archaeon]
MGYGEDYIIQGLQPGYQYEVTLTSSDPVVINSIDSICILTSSCSVTAPEDGSVSLSVNFIAESNGANFTLDMELQTHEGTLDNPVDLTGLMPYSSTVIQDIYNYYVITGLTPGNSYTISDDGVTVRIYQDQFVSDGFSNTDPFTAASDTVWIKVYDSWADDNFTLTLTDNGLPNPIYTAEGSTVSPIELTLDTLYDGQTDYTASYYHVSGLVPGKEYAIGLDKHAGDYPLTLLVYNEAGYTTEVCLDDLVYVGENTYECSAVASASGELWVKVDISSMTGRLLGAHYSMMVYTYFADEGLDWADSNQMLDFSTDIPYSGTVNIESFYTLTGLELNKTYITTISGYDSTVGLSFNLAKAYNWMPGCYATESTPGTLLCTSLSHPDDGTLAFEVYENQNFKGTPFTLDVVLSPHQSEGSASAPLALPVGTASLPHDGSVGAANSYYEITGVTPGQAYTISVNGLQSGRYIYGYDDFANIASTSSYACRDSEAGSGTSCAVRALTTSVWIMVERDVHETAGYTLDVVLSPYQAEGTVDTPVTMSFGVEHNGMIDTTESYYSISGLTAGETYVLTATGVSSDGTPVLYLYDNVALLGSTTYGDYACYRYLSQAEQFCPFTPSATTVWIMVNGDISSSGAVYTLTTAVALQNESLYLDHSASALPYAGTTDNTASTYYIDGLLAYQYYDVTLTNLSGDLDLTVSAYATDTPCDLQTGTTAEACGFTTSSDGRMTIKVLGNKTLYGGTFTLGVTSGPENQGTSTTPFVLDGTSGVTYNGEVSSGSSYYKVTGLAANTFYAVTLTNLTDGASLSVYDTSDFSLSDCSSTTTDTSDKICGLSSNALGEVYIKVMGTWGSTGATFTLGVDLGPTSEGNNTGGEIPLVFGTTDLPYAGSVDNTTSYYAISGLSGNNTYTVSLTNLTGDVSFTAYADDATYSPITGTCSASGSAGGTASCVVDMTNGGSVTSFIKVSGAINGGGATYTLNVVP